MHSILVDKDNRDLVLKVSKLRLKFLQEEFKFSKELTSLLLESNILFLESNLGKTLFISTILKDNKAVSCCYLSINSRASNLLFPTGIYGEIYGVFTLKEFRNKGLARENLKQIIEQAKTINGLSCLVLDSTKQGSKLYQSLGFKKNDKSSTMIYQFR